MTYITFRPDGYEVRSDNLPELPVGALLLTKAEYDGLLNDTLKLVARVVVPK